MTDGDQNIRDRVQLLAQRIEQSPVELTDEHVRELVAELHPADVADLLDRLGEEDRGRVFSVLEPDAAADALIEVAEETREDLLEDLRPTQIAEIIAGMDSDDAADVLAELDAVEKAEVLAGLPEEDRTEAEALLVYDEDTAGGRMAREFVAVTALADVAHALSTIRKSAERVEDLQQIYVVDDDGALLGSVDLRVLILARPDAPVMKLAEPFVINIDVDEELGEVGRLFRQYDLVSLPVVDKVGKLVGVVTHDDALDLIEEKRHAELLRFAGSGVESRVGAGPLESIKHRLPWLYVNLAFALVAANVVGLFEKAIEAATVLAVFMPIVATLGGNSGGQVVALMIRALARDEVGSRGWAFVLRQAVSGVVLGVLTGAAMAVVAYAWKGDRGLSLAVGLAMVANVLVASLLGVLIPLGLRAIRQDPAIASTVVMTACTDAFGFFVFLSLGSVLVGSL